MAHSWADVTKATLLNKVNLKRKVSPYINKSLRICMFWKDLFQQSLRLLWKPWMTPTSCSIGYSFLALQNKAALHGYGELHHLSPTPIPPFYQIGNDDLTLHNRWRKKTKNSEEDAQTLPLTHKLSSCSKHFELKTATLNTSVALNFKNKEQICRKGDVDPGVNPVRS